MTFALRFGADAVRVLAQEQVFKGYFSIRELTLQHRRFEGGWSEPLVREVFDRGDVVGVLPYDPVTDSLVLIEQFRPGAMRGQDSPWMLELVAGVVEPGESDMEVVHREAREEADCELDELLPIARFFTTPGACSERVQLFCGRVTQADIGGVHGLADEGEDILVHAIARTEALQLLREDRISNGLTLVALQWLALQGESLRQRWR
ncbi:MAG: NUDIX domain-containing protein [Parahaliea sp.]